VDVQNQLRPGHALCVSCSPPSARAHDDVLKATTMPDGPNPQSAPLPPRAAHSTSSPRHPAPPRRPCSPSTASTPCACRRFMSVPATACRRCCRRRREESACASASSAGAVRPRSHTVMARSLAHALPRAVSLGHGTDPRTGHRNKYGAVPHEAQWHQLVLAHLEQTFPQADIEFVLGAKAATDSSFFEWCWPSLMCVHFPSRSSPSPHLSPNPTRPSPRAASD